MSILAHWRGKQTGSAGLRANLQECGVLDTLRIFMPILVGPHALDLADPEQTVTLLCEVYAPESFAQTGERAYSKSPRYQLVEKNIHDKPAQQLRFKHHGYSYEVTAQPLPIEEQPDFIATVAADKLMNLTDDLAATQLGLRLQLQNSADTFALHICNYFGLPTQNPLQSLQKIVETDENELRVYLQNHTPPPTPTASLMEGGVS